MELTDSSYYRSMSWIEENSRLTRDYEFRDFKEAMAFVNQVAELAKSRNHHPDILIHGYRFVRIELYSHDVGAITNRDLSLADRIDALLT